ncbi:SpoIID/LytB domain-containing protein [Aeromicrobium massiliense]|uniref:SpoIID/LytB domain-containing protein n=1 Tax=Aeromicrobium massiliense TaxID=1464554 RepID=UPI000675E88B|nr:SpoIID/LytB domain-containing protein [Aeromicrobium massiliense]
MQAWRFARRLTVTTAVFAVVGVAVVSSPPDDTVAGDVPAQVEPSAPAPSETVAPAERPTPHVAAAPEADPAPAADPEPAVTAPEPAAEPEPEVVEEEATVEAAPAEEPRMRTVPVPAKPAAAQGASASRPVVAEVVREDVKGFSMVGVTWAGGSGAEDVVVDVRTRQDGTWGAWESIDVETGGTAATEGTDGIWVGDSDGVAARFRSSNGVVPQDLAVAMVDPGDTDAVVAPDPVVPEEPALPEGAEDDPDAVDAEPLELVAANYDGRPAFTPPPAIITRSRWGAKAAKRCDSPTVATRTLGVVLHHTAGSNSYTKAQSAGIVRSAQKYHMDALGWCDIGYNFLVDKYGQIFEGRAGGTPKMVRGAHAGVTAVNQYTVGVSMMGNYDTAALTEPLKNAVVKIIGWRMATHYIPAKGTVSIGGRKYQRIMGHRDVKATACPGRYGYAWLTQSGGLRDRVAGYVAGYNTAVKRYAARLGAGRTGTVFYGESQVGGGYRTIFMKADIYSKSGRGTRLVEGKILQRYAGLGRDAGVLGFPRSKVMSKSGRYQRFEGGTIYQRTSRSSAYAVWGTAEKLYRSLKETRGALGYPRGSLRKLSSKTYRVTFSKGRIDVDLRSGTARAYDKRGKRLKSRSGPSLSRGWPRPTAGAPRPAVAPVNTSTPAPAPAPSTPATPAATSNKVTVSGTTVAFSGRGFGHGIGMSQYGAYNAAKNHGQTWQQILAYYYPGTSLASRRVDVRVRIEADTTSDVRVKAESGLRLSVGGAVSTLPTGQAEFRLLRDGAATTTLQRKTATGSWTNQRTGMSGHVQLYSTDGTVTLVLPGGAEKAYRGAMRSGIASSTSRRTVNVLTLEQYLLGVVPAEMPTSWHGNAVRAQAVAARTYAMRSMSASRYYDLCDTTSCQVYGGLSAETERGQNAVNATAAQFLAYQGSPALTQFSSSTGGRQADGSMPYLRNQDDKYDAWSTNPNNTWRATVQRTALEKLAPSIGTLRTVQVTKRVGGGTWGGRATTVVLTGTKGSATLTGDKVRFGLGLKSTWFGFA